MQKKATIKAVSKVKDGRKLTHDQSEYIRRQAVHAVRVDNRSSEEVIKVFGPHRSCIYRWLNKYDAGGLSALGSSKAKGPQPKTTEKWGDSRVGKGISAQASHRTVRETLTSHSLPSASRGLF